MFMAKTSFHWDWGLLGWTRILGKGRAMLRHKGLRLALILALGALPFTHLAWTLQALIGLGLIALLILLSRIARGGGSGTRPDAGTDPDTDPDGPPSQRP